ncbi:MAG: hypothetical protein P4L53_06980 [Candidatus Obscuribacterales bacterium]|nr:hypothetical protein [Candidatus Obscuribacterales bacterium]
MKKQFAVIANVICLMIGTSPALSQGDVATDASVTTGDITQPGLSASTSSHTMQLTGGVEQKEQITIPATPATASRKALPELILEVPKLGIVPPVPKFLQAGTTFDQSLYPKEGNVWYRIPKFLAGHWASTEKTIVSTVNLVTGRVNDTPKVEEFVSEINQGFQQDNSGQIWHFDLAPFLGHSIGADNQTHYSYVQKMEPLSCTDNRFVRRVILIKAEVNGSDVIKTSKQFELIQSLTPFGPDKIREDTISRPILQDAPGWRNTSTVIFSLVKPYVPINQNKGRDMREMFREYLESNGLSNLVPKS